MADAPAGGRNTRGQFAKGNPGRAKGTRNRTTIALEKMLDGEAKALTRKAISLAKAGDANALRLVIDRLIPPRKDRPIHFDLPSITSAEDHPAALAAIVHGVATGQITPSEGQAVALMLEQHRKAVEAADWEARISALEGRVRS